MTSPTLYGLAVSELFVHPVETMKPLVQKHSCATCAQRKVKCDKLSPCSNCFKTKSECVYQPPAVSQRHRKRPADEDLLSKLSEYEDLLRKNNITFQPLDNSWIPSPLEEKLVSRPQTARRGSRGPIQAPDKTKRPAEAQCSEQQLQPDLPRIQSGAALLWSGLPKELRDCPIDQLQRPGKDPEEKVTETSSSFGIATCLLIPVCLSGSPQLLELHPEPKHIFKLWQTFAENVNPLTKVIHTPTLQQRIVEISWNLETVTRPLEAVMFSVYALAITSLKPADCLQTFGETRSVLLNRYRSAAAQALIAAELYSTRDLEVLQAFVLFLLLDPRSELSVTAVALAVRIGHKIGLHRTGADPHVSLPFFEQEMRLRLWWQLIGLETRARRKALGLRPPSIADFGEVRMPLNVNDTELHPHMANPLAAEHSRATEMLYCLIKYEVAHYVRSWLATTPTMSPHEMLVSTNPEDIVRKKKVLTDIEQIYEDKYLCHCDLSIPLHHISASVARLTINRLRFWFYHPRYQPVGGQPMSQADQDIMFESSIRLLQLAQDVRMTTFSSHLLEHHLVRTEVEALVYMVSELRQRVRGDLVRAAWVLVRRIYEENPHLLQDNDKFYTALADLTLKAWEARKPEVEAHRDDVPKFIGVLERMRGNNIGPEDAPTALILPDGGFQFGLIHDDDPLDWVYWNELPQL